MSVIGYKLLLPLAFGLCLSVNTLVLANPKVETSFSPSRVVMGRCISVLDGDTVVVLVGRSTYTVHLFGIDAPDKTQPFGLQSKEFLWELAFGQTLAVYSDSVAGKNVVGRLSGWVFAGRMGLNAEQIKRGMAWYDQQEAPKESKLAALESAARFSRLGLWRDKSPVAPWKWRASTTQSKLDSSPSEVRSMQDFTKAQIESWKLKF